MSEQNITVSKLEAAQRQIETAINLWLLDGDPVSIHTLGGAAEGLLIDLADKAGKPLSTIESHAKPEHRNKLRGILRGPRNFFKHADKDPQATLKLNLEVNVYLLSGVVNLFREFTGSASDLMEAFWKYYALHYPDYFAQRVELSSSAWSELRALHKRQFVEELLAAAARARTR